MSDECGMFGGNWVIGGKLRGDIDGAHHLCASILPDEFQHQRITKLVRAERDQ